MPAWCVRARFDKFPDAPFPRASGFSRIKWNYLLLSHQRKVVDAAKDSQKKKSVRMAILPTDSDQCEDLKWCHGKAKGHNQRW